MALLTSEIDTMLDAYVECALWSSTDDADRPMDRDYSRADIDGQTLATMRRDVVAFLATNGGNLIAHQGSPDVVLSRAGHDLWLTRNGHGAGFWDGDWPEPEASRLSEASRKLGPFTLYIGDDGKVYGMNG